MPFILGLVLAIAVGILAVLVAPWTGRFYRAAKRQYPNVAGAEPRESAGGLVPEPLEMTASTVQLYPDGALCWMPSHHLMATGMPASGPTQREDSAWKVITFTCHMPRLSAEARQRLLAAWGDGHRGG